MPLKAELQPHRTMSKLWAFKLLIGLQVLQSVIYQILTALDPSPLVPSAYLSPVDIGIGIPMMIVNIEMVFFAMFYYYAYTVGPYKLQSGETRALGPLRASLQMLNQGELMAGTLFVLTIKRHARVAAARIGDGHVREPKPEEGSWWMFWQKTKSHRRSAVPKAQGVSDEARRKDSVDSAWSVPIALGEVSGAAEDGRTQRHSQSVIGVAR
ncbi:uncharacterized protein B0I36DRAFT_334105 [Microdochium trichocladiopsis]|uniref:Uncharacterized protein n=1 Tax=Microdochium trichocladiopsis TaxID=1682393 RepID=A0A9P8XW51_9PEZI|nr:uncharacterized protein B0I36DRAFT_334105 [Microdochium trichocladiopsis]KAH7021244.1 hypothetical protein B0I36DRAFT_334105 [Microdochium trichocladiopsis]